ncbi:MAG TPA: hypothetical protein VK186_17950 [Candidatus Deferrimicrobium sp.]|nr:hypothetical protein [Candidatus Deferrimicrobium sp.]
MLAFFNEVGEWNYTQRDSLLVRGVKELNNEGKKQIINKSIAYPYNNKDKSDKMI